MDDAKYPKLLLKNQSKGDMESTRADMQSTRTDMQGT